MMPLIAVEVPKLKSKVGLPSLPKWALWRNLQRPFELATALNQLAGVLSATDEYTAAMQAYEECRELYQALGYRRGVATATQNIGGILFDLGDYARARALFCDALRIRHELGLPRGYAYSFEFFADVNEAEKRYADAVHLLAAADTLHIRIGAPDRARSERSEAGRSSPVRWSAR